MSVEEDPKEVAKKERRSPEVERLLRQFRSIESCNANTEIYVENHEKIFSNKCLDCDGFGTVGISGKYTRTEEKCPSCDGSGKKVP